ncbi:MAG TPA: hypothetical protein VJB66_04840 [Candidatus Nanoarchaeia archaeon]|nr:hypothetical protein [Candidatus Nanoarchaeia archaeon]
MTCDKDRGHEVEMMKKALVIEDQRKYQDDAREYGRGHFVVPTTLSEIEKELRETKYEAILLDRI